PHFENASSVDELHAVHKKYLSAVLARCFLGPKAVSMITVLNGCLDTIAFFCAAISNDPPALPDATKASMAFSKTALLFVKAIRNLIKANYEPWLEDLLLRLDMSEFYTRQDR
uniref:Gamma tubulin complex component C-terminal domain-containing protein n=1 Tax=Plectus sambesii TaxID=2011161 RepID=A0A914V6X5_9BILA